MSHVLFVLLLSFFGFFIVLWYYAVVSSSRRVDAYTCVSSTLTQLVRSSSHSCKSTFFLLFFCLTLERLPGRIERKRTALAQCRKKRIDQWHREKTFFFHFFVIFLDLKKLQNLIWSGFDDKQIQGNEFFFFLRFNFANSF